MENVFTKTLGGCLNTGRYISSRPIDMSILQSSPKLAHPVLQIVALSLEVCHKRCGRPKSRCKTHPQAQRNSQIFLRIVSVTPHSLMGPNFP